MVHLDMVPYAVSTSRYAASGSIREVLVKVQVVVAHPDDETFGCGSLLLHAKAAGAVTAVACATRGEAGGDRADLAQVRERELRAAGDVLGVDRIDVLDFADSGMNGPADDSTLVGAEFDAVVAAAARVMQDFGPDIVVTLDASDGHRDHVRIRDATLAAADALGVPRVYLACLPRSLMQRWVEHMRAERPEVEHLDADTAALGTPDADITTLIDARAHLARREQAIALHASQTSPFEGLPAELRTAFLADVHARRVRPPWDGGVPETQLFG
jgi:LmbE family N-acetylglucosaminyl deacetylase